MVMKYQQATYLVEEMKLLLSFESIVVDLKQEWPWLLEMLYQTYLLKGRLTLLVPQSWG
jgi:hypothetical protein